MRGGAVGLRVDIEGEKAIGTIGRTQLSESSARLILPIVLIAACLERREPKPRTLMSALWRFF